MCSAPLESMALRVMVPVTFGWVADLSTLGLTEMAKRSSVRSAAWTVVTMARNAITVAASFV
jgi:hypothetical protein